MRRLIFIGAAFAAMALAAGCAGTAVRQNTQRIETIERETEDLSKSLESVRVSLEQISASLDAFNKNAAALQEQIERPMRIKQGTGRAIEKIGDIERKLDSLERRNPSDVLVKVLNGNGNQPSAKRLAAVLRTEGYNVGEVGMSSSGGFRSNTIFFAEGFDAAAEAMAKSLGVGVRVRPLTWGTVYDIIVVTGGVTGSTTGAKP